MHNLDDLKSVADANLRERQRRAAAAEAIVDGEVREFLDWRRSLEAVPLLVELRLRGKAIGRAEVEKVRERLGPITKEQAEALEVVTTAIVNKLLHPPTLQLKEMARRGNASEQVAFIRDVFGLDGPPAPKAPVETNRSDPSPAMLLQLDPARP